jgi:hypothetical protein
MTARLSTWPRAGITGGGGTSCSPFEKIQPFELSALLVEHRDGPYWNHEEPDPEGLLAGLDAEFLSVRELDSYLGRLPDDRTEHEARPLDAVPRMRDRPKRRGGHTATIATTLSPLQTHEAVLEGLRVEAPPLATKLAASNNLFVGQWTARCIRRWLAGW